MACANFSPDGKVGVGLLIPAIFRTKVSIQLREI